MAAGCLSDPEPICETFRLGVDGILKYRDASVVEQAANTAS